MTIKPADILPLRRSLGKPTFDDLLSNLDTPQTKRSNLFSSPGGTIVTPSRSGSADPSSGASAKRTSPPTSRFESRLNALEVVECLNDHLSPAQSGSGTHSRVALSSTADPQAYNYRYMFEKIMQRSEVLDSKIDASADLLRQYYNTEDFGDPGATSPEDLVYIGRIQLENTESAEGGGDVDKLTAAPKLSASSMVLETSRMYGAGVRIPLRFEKDVKVRGVNDGQGGIGLFPGMIVAMKGRNAGGSYLGVQEIIMLPPMDLAESGPDEMLKYQYGANKLAGQPLSLITACGPYTTDDNLDYAPLEALCVQARRIRPDVLLLLGPFIDERHPMIRAGDVDELPSGIFAKQVSSRLSQVLSESPNTNIILIPGARDLLSNNAVFPQGPYDREPHFELPKRVKLLPNPALFSINEIVFAVTSTDSLFHLNNQEFFKEAREMNGSAELQKCDTSSDTGKTPINTAGHSENAGCASNLPKDRMARMCRHILRQRSFYPVFPPPTGAGIELVNLDVTHLGLAEITVGPDIMILPSMLRYFAKVVDSTVVVNPSVLTRAANGGTFARVTVHAMPRGMLEFDPMPVDGEEQHLEHRVYERARVDIVRI